MYEFDIGKTYVLFIKPEYDNYKRARIYTGQILERDGNKIKILDIEKKIKIIDLDSVFEIKEKDVRRCDYGERYKDNKN